MFSTIINNSPYDTRVEALVFFDCYIMKNVGIRICPPADEVLGDLACWQTE